MHLNQLLMHEKGKKSSGGAEILKIAHQNKLEAFMYTYIGYKLLGITTKYYVLRVMAKT